MPDIRPIEGIGHASAHHGELLQGVFDDSMGHLHRALLTLPMRSRPSIATFVPDKGDTVDVCPAGRTKAAQAARLTLDRLKTGRGGLLTINTTIPTGHGFGSSTADVVASIRAVAAASGTILPAAAISRLAVQAETAADSIAYADRPVLFAHREGEVLEYFGGEFPPMHILGGRTRSTPIDTLSLLPARYNDEEIQLFKVLRGMIAGAMSRQDSRLLGRAATISATISQRRLPKPGFAKLVRLAGQYGACGVQVAHSGTLFGFLFDAGDRRAVQNIASLRAAAAQLGLSDFVLFSLNAEELGSDVGT